MATCLILWHFQLRRFCFGTDAIAFVLMAKSKNITNTRTKLRFWQSNLILIWIHARMGQQLPRFCLAAAPGPNEVAVQMPGQFIIFIPASFLTLVLNPLCTPKRAVPTLP